MTDDPTNANPPPRHLTFHDVLVALGQDHDHVRELALVALNEATGCSPRAAERLLDGPFGVGLAATVVSLMRVNEMALDAAMAEAIRRQLTLQHLRGGIKKALPSGVAEAFERIADYGFVQAVWPLIGQTELVVLFIAASVMIADEADVPGEAVVAFLRHPDTG